MARIKIEDLPRDEMNDDELDRVAGGLTAPLSNVSLTSFYKEFDVTISQINLTGTNFQKI